MKKRLFISSILMTLVLLVAITTATFAWYSANQGNVTVKESSRTLQINAADPNYTISAKELDLDVTVSRVDAGATHALTAAEATQWNTKYSLSGGDAKAENDEVALPLELATFKESGTLTHYYLDSNGTPREKTSLLGVLTQDWAIYSVTVKAAAGEIDGIQWTKEQVAAAMEAANETFTVVITPDGGSRALFFADATAANRTDVSKLTMADLTTAGSASLTLVSAQAIDADDLVAGYTFYFALYIDGSHQTGDPLAETEDTSPVSGDFVVTLS